MGGSHCFGRATAALWECGKRCRHDLPGPWSSGYGSRCSRCGDRRGAPRFSFWDGAAAGGVDTRPRRSLRLGKGGMRGMRTFRDDDEPLGRCLGLGVTRSH